MFRRITGSLAYRLPGIYRRLLHFRRVGQLPLKEQNNVVVLMMTGRKFLLMTRLAVLSIARTWNSLPRLIIASDGSVSEAQIRKHLSFWNASISICAWDETASYHRNKNRMALAGYGDVDAFGKKLGFILHKAAQEPVVWIDSDILFYRDFLPFLPTETEGFSCGGAEDFVAAYDPAVLQKLEYDLYAQYAFNAGLLYVSGDAIYESFRLENLISGIHPTYDFCTEQSIFAHIASASMGILWKRDVVESFNSDNQQLRPMPADNKVARHYTTNVRHLFWRDAFFNLK